MKKMMNEIQIIKLKDGRPRMPVEEEDEGGEAMFNCPHCGAELKVSSEGKESSEEETTD